MSVLSLLVTNEGLQKCIEAKSNEGWYIYPTGFRVAETKGTFDTSRTMASMETTWFTAAISSKTAVPPNSVTFICTIPAEAALTEKDIWEIYIMAQDQYGVEFLLAIAQPNNVIYYDPDGSVTFRLQITIANIDLTSLIVFHYTQATEISEHDANPMAHPDIRHAIAKAGIYIYDADYNYEGQLWLENPSLDSTVFDKMVVEKRTDNKFYPAVYDGNNTLPIAGIALKYKDSKEYIGSGSYYGLMDRVYPTTKNEYTYINITSGSNTSGATEPTWPVVSGATVLDGNITWMCDPNPYVVAGGFIDVDLDLTTFPVNTKVSLDPSTPGGVVPGINAVPIGVSMGGGVLHLKTNYTESTAKVYTKAITTGDWVYDGTEAAYYYDIDITNHLTNSIALWKAYDTDTDESIDPMLVEATSTTNIRVWMPINTVNVSMVLSN